MLFKSHSNPIIPISFQSPSNLIQSHPISNFSHFLKLQALSSLFPRPGAWRPWKQRKDFGAAKGRNSRGSKVPPAKSTASEWWLHYASLILYVKYC